MPRKTDRNSFDKPDPILDATNLEILRCLIDDPRLAMSELGRRVGMSAPAVTERVQRMQEAGVIRGARLDVDQAALGLGITAFVRVRPMPGQLQNIAELARATPEIVECHRVTGEDCFIMKVLVGRVELLEAVLDEILKYGNTTSSIVQSTPVPLRPAPLPRPARR
ncbi:MAG TPA: Lrp/AsnC family transcriptional regulator [Rhodanobacteraceae bacterium]|nr:Lrp/AsnC family transcriptional regulator [Rhodanobacteraceae bacterium]